MSFARGNRLLRRRGDRRPGVGRRGLHAAGRRHVRDPSQEFARQPDAEPEQERAPSAYRLEWAALIKRIYSADVLVCGRCQGKMRVLAVIDEAEAVRKILAHLGLPAVPLPVAPPRGPPQPVFAFDPA